ncbi:MAG: MBL fold metallo-hydrolase [Phycisphaerales bacterium JB039]
MTDYTLQGLELGPFATNCYIYAPGPGPACWIIDAGLGPEPLIAAIRQRELKPEKLILTHAHLDHIGGVDAVSAAFPGVELLIHEAERDWLTNADLNLSGGYGFPVTCRPADRLLRDGDELSIGAETWRVLHTPGHSPGGVTLYNADRAVAFVGDTLFAGSIGRTDFPNSSFDTLAESIRQRLYSLPPDTRALPGHGPATTIGREMRSNPFVRAD